MIIPKKIFVAKTLLFFCVLFQLAGFLPSVFSDEIQAQDSAAAPAKGLPQKSIIIPQQEIGESAHGAEPDGTLLPDSGIIIPWGSRADRAPLPPPYERKILKWSDSPALDSFRPSVNIIKTVTPQKQTAPAKGEDKLSPALSALLRPENPESPDLKIARMKERMMDLKSLVVKDDEPNLLPDPVLKKADQDLVNVYVRADLSALNRLDGLMRQMTDKNEAENMASGWVTMDQLKTLGALDGVMSVYPVIPPIVRAGSAMTQGDAIHQADDVRALFGQDGTGVKIGVISDGVDHLASAQSKGDLPANVHVLSNIRGGDEGTAMLEIIHDLAPGAELYFHDHGGNVIRFNAGIDALIAAGCKIIVDDIGWVDEPYFEDGAAGSHVARTLASRDILYISSAGNTGTSHYQGIFLDDGFGFHDFGKGARSYLYVTIPDNGYVQIAAQWNDRFGASSNDYDLYLSESAVGDLAFSDGYQTGTQNPFEYIYYYNTSGFSKTAQIDLYKSPIAENKTLEVYIYTGGGTSISSTNISAADSIYGHPAVSGAIAVGAVSAGDPGNDTIENFSSQGPVTIIGESPRQKPDLTGADGVSVSGAGGFPNPFYGTSASAPHIAAIAAQLWQKAPVATGHQIRDYLYSTATDLGDAGFDPVFGHGRADVLSSFQTLPTLTAALNDEDGFVNGTETSTGMNINVSTINIQDGRTVFCDITSSGGETAAYGPVSGTVRFNAATLVSGNLSALNDGMLTLLCSATNSAGFPAEGPDTSMKDATAPALTQTASVPAATKDNTPDYAFSSTEAGAITYGGSCSSVTTNAAAGNNTVTFNAVSDGTYPDCSLTVTDILGNMSLPLAVPAFTVDTVPPVLNEIIPVMSPTKDNTPDYTFSSTEAGAIVYAGPCVSAAGNAVAGDNTIAFDPLADGTYPDCSLTVTDAAGNASATLAVFAFTIDGIPPVLTEITPVPTPSNNRIPLYTFHTNEAGAVAYGGSCRSGTTDVTVGNNTIQLGELAEGVYADCAVTVTDPGGNASLPLRVSSFVIDLTAPVLTAVLPIPSLTGDTTPDYTFRSTEAGTIAYGGPCSGAKTDAAAGNNTVTLRLPADGLYADCAVTVIDGVGNISAPLAVAEFRVDTAGPVITISAPAKNSNMTILSTTVRVADAGGVAAENVHISPATTAGTSDFVCSQMNANQADCAIKITSSGDLTIEAADHLSHLSSLTETGYLIDSTLPAVNFTIPVKISNAPVAGTFIRVTGKNPVRSANVTVDTATTAGISDFNCFQVSLIQVHCTITITSGGDLTIRATDDLGNVGIKTETGYVIETVPPSLSMVSSIRNPGNDPTPDFTFNSTETGMIAYTGVCSGMAAFVSAGDNTITLNELSDGMHSNCGITVTDAAGNVSAGLKLTPFMIDTVLPVLGEVTPVITPTPVSTPDFTFSSTESGTIYYSGLCASPATSATIGNNTITLNALADGVYTDCALAVTDNAGNVSAVLVFSAFTVDASVPALNVITPIPSLTNDRTPSYTFHSNEAGAITYGGACRSGTMNAAIGNNTVMFNTLADGTYADCAVTVTDTGGNASAPLIVSAFTVDATPPALFETTSVATITDDATPDFTFSSTEAGAITYGGACRSGTMNAAAGSNTLTFSALAEGVYEDCNITVTDAAGNTSLALTVSAFTLIPFAPPAAPPGLPADAPPVSFEGDVSETGVREMFDGGGGVGGGNLGMSVYPAPFRRAVSGAVMTRSVTIPPSFFTTNSATGVKTARLTESTGKITLAPISGWSAHAVIPPDTLVTGSMNWNGEILPPIEQPLSLIGKSGGRVRGAGERLLKNSVLQIFYAGAKGMSLTFSRPVLFRIPADAAENSALYVYSSADGRTWKPAAIAAVSQKWASFETDHFSLFALTAQPFAAVAGKTAIRNARKEEVLTLDDRKPAGFADTENHWARNFISAMLAEGVLTADAGSLFMPDSLVTRGQTARMAAAAFDLPVDSGLAATSFADVRPDSADAPYIEAVYRAGWIPGRNINGKLYFYPDAPIARLDALILFMNGGGVGYAGEADRTAFSDVPVDSGFSGAAAFAKKNGFIAGYSDNTFRPREAVTRAEAAQMLALIYFR